MYVLGLDTSTAMGSVGVVSEEKLIGEYTLSVARTHSEKVMAVVDQVLKDADISASDISGIAVTLGPGSFTGLRIGVVTAKGLAYALGKPILGFSTLQVMAENFRYSDGLICPILDARRGEVYGGIYRYDPEVGHMVDVINDVAMDFIEFLNIVEKYDEKVIFCGEVDSRFASIIYERLGSKAIIPSNTLMAVRGGIVAELGLKAFLKGEEPHNVFTLRPLYLRRSGAEISKDKKVLQVFT